MRNILAVLLLLVAPLAFSAEIRGKVVNQTTGEVLGNVAVALVDTTNVARTSWDGTFSLGNVPAGKYTLRVDAVGFWYHRLQIEVASADVKDFTISLTPQGARRTDTVEVTADVFGGAEPAAVSQLTLTTSELKQTDTVLGSDLFRSVQTLPGVTNESNNDFFGQFMVLGAPFRQVGVYVDGVLVRQPFHGISTQDQGASIGVMNDDLIETLTLTPLAFSERYGEATGGVLDIKTREGSREGTRMGVGVGMAESHGTMEGPLPAKKGSWLLSARKSYLGYLTRHSVGEDQPLEPSFSDVDARVTYDLTPNQSIDLLGIYGASRVDDTWDGYADPYLFFSGKSNFTLLRSGWRAELSPSVLLSNYLAYMRQSEVSRNNDGRPIEKHSGGDWSAGMRLDWNLLRGHTLEVGANARRQSGDSIYFWYRRPDDPESQDGMYRRAGTGVRYGGYLHEGSSLWHSRVHVLGSVRIDKSSEVAAHPISAQFSGSLAIGRGAHLIAGLGNFVQYADISELQTPCGWSAKAYEESQHYMAGFEQRLGENSRVRLQGFHRETAGRWGIRDAGSGVVGSTDDYGVCGPIEPVWGDRGQSFPDVTDGAQIIFQRRSSNRLSGWVSYTYLVQRVSAIVSMDRGDGRPVQFYRTFRGIGDQRNSVNVFGMYRLRPTLNLSGKLLYGSGYPGSSFLESIDQPVYMDGRLVNGLLTNTFLRVDLRVDKSFTVKARRMNLHVEFLNVTNHKNIRYIGSGLALIDGQPQYAYQASRAIRFTPTAGIDFQF